MAKPVSKLASEITDLRDSDKLKLVDKILTSLHRPTPEIDKSIARILAYPEIGPELEPGVRRCLLPRFLFGLIYSTDEEFLTVIAVAHLHREPRYWIGRP